MIFLIRFLATLALVCSVTSTMHAQENAVASAKVGKVMIVLDGSNSMWGQVDGEAKITIAKDVMTDLITNWDDSVDLGLTVYGHRRKGDCADIEVVAMPGKVDRQALIDKVQSITPRGKTPISKTLSLAALSVGFFSGKSSVVLVSDGLETCNADPCAQAKSLGIINPGFDVHVIGFDVTEEEFKSLQCIATETGGKFFRANNAEELKDALRQTVAATPAPDPTPTAEPEPSFFLYAKLCETCDRLPTLDVSWDVKRGGADFYKGLGVLYPNDPVFEPGSYQVTARYFSSALARNAEIVVGQNGQQIGEVNLDGGGVILSAYAGDDKTLAADSMFYEFFPIVDGAVSSKRINIAVEGGGVTWLPSGNYKVVAKHQSITETVELEIVAGETIKHTFDMRFGYLKPSAVMMPGGPKVPSMAFRVYSNRDAANAGGDGLAFGLAEIGSKIALKPGTYFLKTFYSVSSVYTARVDPVNVESNAIAEPVINLNVGLVDYQIVSAENAYNYFGVDLLKVTADAQNGAKLSFSVNRIGKAVLPAGQHRLGIHNLGEYQLSDVFEVVAGETTKLNVSIP